MKSIAQSRLDVTGQISLFASEFLSESVPISDMMQALFGHQKTEKKSVKDCPVLHRLKDPLTSVRAAEKAKEFRTRHIAKIWACLKDNGKLNYKEIAKLTGLEPVAVARRRKEMESDKLIEVLGEERNGCALWVAL